MDGILIIDKPAGMTSHDVVARVRRILGTRRVGHTGTLDPFATGVMVILVGKATRLARFLDKDTKEYVAEVQFGFETDTGDVTGKQKTEGGKQQEEIADVLSTTDWPSVLAQFRGEILQTPPMYSAKKVDGKKLYELARQGKEVERKPVAISIHELDIVGDDKRIEHGQMQLRAVCSAGTYVRTLAEEIGRAIGTGAHLSALRRTAAGKFDLEQSRGLEDLQSLPDPASALLRVDAAVSHLAEVRLSEDRVEKTKSGLSTRVDEDKFIAGQHVRMTRGEGDLVAIGIYDDVEKVIRPKVVLI